MTSQVTATALGSSNVQLCGRWLNPVRRPWVRLPRPLVQFQPLRRTHRRRPFRRCQFRRLHPCRSFHRLLSCRRQRRSRQFLTCHPWAEPAHRRRECPSSPRPLPRRQRPTPSWPSARDRFAPATAQGALPARSRCRTDTSTRPCECGGRRRGKDQVLSSGPHNGLAFSSERQESVDWMVPPARGEDARGTPGGARLLQRPVRRRSTTERKRGER